MAAICKQLEAAQSFLRQVAQLPNFASLREKQHCVLLALVRKTKALSLKDANSIFQMMDASVWSDELSEALRAAISGCLVADHQVDDHFKRGPKPQDFQNFLGFLTESQWQLLQQASSVLTGCSLLAGMLSHLGLRHPSEWTFGTMYCFMHLVLGVEVPEPSTAYGEICKLKTAIRKQFESLQEPSVHLQQLPSTPAMLPESVLQDVYCSEPATPGKITKELLSFTTSQISMRKSSDKVVDKLLPATPADPMQAMAGIATALTASLVATHRPQAGPGLTATPPPPVRQASRPLLALCDAPYEHLEPEERVQEQPKVEDPAASVDASQLPDHLDKLRASLGRSSSGGHMKRPAAAGPGAQEESVSQELTGSDKPKAKGKAKVKAKAKAKSTAKGVVLRKPAAADKVVLLQVPLEERMHPLLLRHLPEAAGALS